MSPTRMVKVPSSDYFPSPPEVHQPSRKKGPDSFPGAPTIQRESPLSCSCDHSPQGF